MIWLPTIILALIQGITEFLPISSSGHLVLVHEIFDQDLDWDNRLIMDVAVHVGTLLSVLLYFHKDVLKMIKGLFSLAKADTEAEGAKLDIHILIASIPVIVAGAILNIMEPSWLDSLNIIAITSIVFGVLLWAADRAPQNHKTLNDMTIKDAIKIGIAQSLALIPGTSRSGITMTASRFLGYSRTESAHFSLLLAIIAISGAGAIGVVKLLKSENAALGLEAAIAATIAFITGYIAIALMMKWLEKFSFTPFAIYRIILGIILLVIINL